MEDGTVTASSPTPPVVGRVAATAEPTERAIDAEKPPRPRERAVGAKKPPRLREGAVTVEKPPRPRVWARAIAAAASNADGPDPFFFLAAAGVDISGTPNRRGECEVQMDQVDWGK